MRGKTSPIMRVAIIAAAVSVFMSVVVPCVWSLGYRNPLKMVSGLSGYSDTATPTFLTKYILPEDRVEVIGEATMVNYAGPLPTHNGKVLIRTLWPDFDQAFPQLLASRTRAFGLPFRSMWYSAELFALDRNLEEEKTTVVQGIEFGKIQDERSSWCYERSVLPLGIRWSQMLGNLAAWSGLVIAAWMGVGAIQRRRRSKNGLCKHCGYPVGSDRCPECGKVTK